MWQSRYKLMKNSNINCIRTNRMNWSSFKALMSTFYPFEYIRWIARHTHSQKHKHIRTRTRTVWFKLLLIDSHKFKLQIHASCTWNKIFFSIFKIHSILLNYINIYLKFFSIFALRHWISSKMIYISAEKSNELIQLSIGITSELNFVSVFISLLVNIIEFE